MLFVYLGKQLHICVLQFLHLRNKDKSTFLIVLLGLNGLICVKY